MSRIEPVIDAVVVTHNRLEKLKNCIEAILRQDTPVRHIHVVDNASTDETRDWLRSLPKEHPVEPLLLPTNGGGAGGFYAGVKKAYQEGADWTWLMDDDVVPAPDCLGALVKSPYFQQHRSSERNIGFLSSRVEWTDGSVCLMNIPVAIWPWNGAFHEMASSLRCRANSFVSCLIARESVEAVGLPVKEFFIWYDDIEYTTRISRRFECYYIDSSVCVHDRAENSLPAYRNIDRSNLWRYKLDIRNVTAVEARLGRRFDKMIAMRIIAFRSLQALKGSRNINIFVSIFLSGIRGLFWNYKKLIERV